MSSAERWETIARVARERLASGLRPLIVCSALEGVTNDLSRLVRDALSGGQDATLEEIAVRHAALARSLGLDPALLAEDLDELRRLAAGVSLVREASPGVQARVLAAGEILASRLGAAYLLAAGVSAAWLDARDCLTSLEEPAGSRRRHLAAVCSDDPDPALRASLGAQPERALVTQGFIARDGRGETVLLGRGGSDVSAAYFAARLSAERCEIWTDVPGMFTANPRHVPDARLLRALDYAEAQEIAATGAKVLHPRCIPPLERHAIPLHIRSTPHPDVEGTVVTAHAADAAPQVKAVASRGGITLISMDTVRMWRQVGFLADAFRVFKEHGLSIDLVSTSESNVTVSLDPETDALDPPTMRSLLRALGSHCRVQAIGPCAAVSLVGRQIRAALPQLAPALEAFEERRIHLVTQAANDLNLTFVVDEEEAGTLVKRLHALLFDRGPGDDPHIGPTSREIEAGPPREARGPRAAWWAARRDELLAIASERAPCYVYDIATVRAAAENLRALGVFDRILYALKANPHPAILAALAGAGLGMECASLGEVEHVLATLAGFDPSRILFTPNFAPRAEYDRAFTLGAHVTVDALHPIREWPETFRGRGVFLRLDPGEGRGHHRHVRTGGERSKFGITADQLDELSGLIERAGALVTGLHAHVGSGILASESWAATSAFLAEAAARFPGVRVLDIGGGLGVPERTGGAALDLGALAEAVARVRAAHPAREIWLEPGRYLVAESGVLLARVTQIKQKGALTFVGIETGMNSLIRPALYGAWHDIVNLTRYGEPADMTADIVGPICESGDVLGHARAIASAREGDVILIATTGAYGRSMSSRYNLREPAGEIALEP